MRIKPLNRGIAVDHVVETSTCNKNNINTGKRPETKNSTDDACTDSEKSSGTVKSSTLETEGEGEGKERVVSHPGESQPWNTAV